MPPLETDLDSLPNQPGAYLMKVALGEVLYIGKALDLRARVRQYFGALTRGDGRFHIAFLVPRIRQVEVVITRTEREALVLEDTLIKKYRPRYNVQLKDDKTWESLRLPLAEPWPRISTVRRWRDDQARYFGPFLHGITARKVLQLLVRTIPLRTCSDSVFRAHSERPCIEYQMKRCPGPCAGLIAEDDYRGLLDEAVLLLEGRTKELAKSLRVQMAQASETQRYEDAARLRDRLGLVERLGAHQSAARPGARDSDVFGMHREGELAAVAILPIRDGRLQDARSFIFRGLAEDDGELLGRLITQLYSPTTPPPGEILVPRTVDSASLRAELLGELAGRKVRLLTPKRGDRRHWLDLAGENARVRFETAHSKRERSEQALAGLQRALRLPALPRRIEAYDNSNIQGKDPVGAMVTFVDGQPNKQGYRIFRIKTVDGPDDYATMQEVFRRRFRRALDGDPKWSFPDLVVVDGGRGQLAMAVQAVRDLGIDVVGLDGQAIPPACGGPLIRVVSIAKPRKEEQTDKIYEPGRSNALALRPHEPSLQLLQRLRDEAHRFGVSHHRKRRTRRTLHSQLDEVPGVGPTLRKRLLRHFGSMKALQTAEVGAITAVPGVGPRLAEAIADALGSKA
ncbi:MAG: excinuclease ABC subunit UvrC [Myxococcota bacterium]|nr:excinuclease ABC subunit UvrC [Myxococcota bacterium]